MTATADHARTTDGMAATAGNGHATDGNRCPYRIDDKTYPFDTDDVFELPAEFAGLRAEHPVARARVATGDEVWLVSGYEEARQVLGDRRFSRNVFREDAARLIPGVPVRQVSSPFVEPPGHTRWRRLMAKAFTAKHVEGMRGQVQHIVDRLVGAMAAQGPPVDLMAAFAYPLSITVMCEMLGIAEDQHEPFRKLADAALTVNDLTPEEKAEAYRGMDEFSRGLIAAKREQGGDDLLGQLVGIHDAEDGRLDEDELVATILAMLIGGYESTVMQIGKSVQLLLRHPEQLAALQADPDLIGAAVEETLRYGALDSGFGSPRYATEDAEVAGVVIPKGATVLVIRASGSRDERVYDDGERFDIRRDARHHLAFGHGAHVCLGMSLARLQLELGIGTLVRELPGLRPASTTGEVPWDYRITVAGPAILPVAW